MYLSPRSQQVLDDITTKLLRFFNYREDALEGIGLGSALYAQSKVRESYLGRGSDVTIHVSVNGSDTNGDGTEAKPYATPGRALLDVPHAPLLVERRFVIQCGPGTYDNVDLRGVFSVESDPTRETNPGVIVQGSYDLDETVTVQSLATDATDPILRNITANAALGFSIVANETFMSWKNPTYPAYFYMEPVVSASSPVITTVQQSGSSNLAAGAEIRIFTLGTTFNGVSAKGTNVQIYNVRLGTGFHYVSGIGRHVYPVMTGITHASDGGQLFMEEAWLTASHINATDPGTSAYRHELINVNVRKTSYNSTCNTLLYAGREYNTSVHDIRHHGAMSSADRAKFTLVGGTMKTTTNSRMSFAGQGTALSVINNATFVARSDWYVGTGCSRLWDIQHGAIFRREIGTVSGEACTSNAVNVRTGGTALVSGYTGLASTPAGSDIKLGATVALVARTALPATDLAEAATELCRAY